MGIYKDQHAGDWAGSVFGAPMGVEASNVTPWRKSLNQILLGIALCMVQVNHLELERIMPMIGCVLLFLGFRTLRQESGWFRWGFILSCVRGVMLLGDFLVSSGIWIGVIHESTAYQILMWVFRGLFLGTLLCFRQGIRGVLVNGDRVADTRSADAVMGVYVLSVLLGLLGNHAIVEYAQIGLLALTLWMLYRLLGQLSEAGYDVYTCFARIGDILTSVIVVVVAVACMMVGSFGGCRYSMQWQTHTPDSEAHKVAMEKLKRVDGEVLADLSEADVTDFRDAVSVNVFQTYYGFAKNWKTAPDEADLCVTVIVGVLPDKSSSYENRSVVFCHFRWLNDYTYGGADCVMIPLRDLVPVNLSGQVLYNRDGTVYRADMAGVSVKSGEDAQQQGAVLSGTFSLPTDGENCRGYIRMDVDGVADMILKEWVLNAQNTVRYIHHYPLPQLPFMTAEEYGLREDGQIYDPQFRQAQLIQ